MEPEKAYIKWINAFAFTIGDESDGTPYIRADIHDTVARERDELAGKVRYVEGMGLRFGMLKTSDRPEPYLAHEWVDDSDYMRMFREWTQCIGMPEQLAKAEKERDEALEELGKVIMACPPELRTMPISPSVCALAEQARNPIAP